MEHSVKLIQRDIHFPVHRRIVMTFPTKNLVVFVGGPESAAPLKSSVSREDYLFFSSPPVRNPIRKVRRSDCRRS